MEPFILVLKGKRLFCKDEDTISPVGDNSDYIIKFEGVSKTAVFAVFNRDGKTQKISLDENKEVLIPLWVLKKGSFEVGLYSDGVASTAVSVYVRASVMEDDYEQTEDVPQSMVDQLIELVNKDISSVEETKTQAVAAKNAAEAANEEVKTALESITSKDGYLNQIKGYAEAAKSDATSAAKNAEKIQGAVTAANEALAEAKNLGKVADEIIGEGGTFAEPKDGTALKQIREIKEAVTTAKTEAQAAQTAAESAQTEAQTAKSEAQAAQTAAETAQAGAQTAQAKAEEAQTAAETAQSEAQAAQAAAESAQAGAETAQGKAGEAKTAAETARTATETAQGKAEAAQTAAESAQTEAQTAQAKAEEAQTAAETAQSEAQTAKSEAQAAQTAAETAQAGAETAQGKAGEAKTAAETARDQAQSYADQAYQTVFGDAITTALSQKVDKEEGKGLSANDFTDVLKTKLDGVAESANNYSLPEATAGTLGGVKVGANLSIGADGTLSADAQQIAVDEELSDTSTNPVQNKIIYKALGEKDTAIAKKVDKETGKGLSSNDFTDLLKTKLDGVTEGANKTVTDDELSSTSTNPIENRIVTVALSGKASVTHSHGISEVTNLQATLDGKASSVHSHSLDEISETDSKKILTSQERTKLAGIAEGANNYSLPVATASTRGGVLIEAAVTSGSSKAVTSGAVFARIGNLKFAVSSSAPTSADENTITFVV